MRVIEFKLAQLSSEMDRPIFRALADRPLVDNKLHPDDVMMLNTIAEALSTKDYKVIWIWYRWSR